MKKMNILVSLPGDNYYLHEQEAAAKSTAQRLGIELRVINAKSDPVTQSQQVLEVIQSRTNLPDGVTLEEKVMCYRSMNQEKGDLRHLKPGRPIFLGQLDW